MKNVSELANRLAQYGSYYDPSKHEQDCIDAAMILASILPLEAKARRLVDLMDDAERNHGSLVGSKTLTAVNELRLELSRWK